MQARHRASTWIHKDTPNFTGEKEAEKEGSQVSKPQGPGAQMPGTS